ALVGVPGVAERFEKILRTAPQTNTIVVAAARTGDLPGMFDPWSRYLVSLRRVLLLQPTRDDSLYFGLTLPDIPQPICAGRGMLIEGSEFSIVQTFDMDAT
ncbi:MAG: hypothetical protein WBF71_04195, partial [Microthrixaceae bacterium]